jgi:hypothetical protein
MDTIADELQKLILDNLRKTVPVAAKQAKKASPLLDSSTRQMGYIKILKKGYTP